MNTELVNAVKETGRFSSTTIDYWAEWLVARKATPPDIDAFLYFIAMMQNDVEWGLKELLPNDWLRNATETINLND